MGSILEPLICRNSPVCLSAGVLRWSAMQDINVCVPLKSSSAREPAKITPLLLSWGAVEVRKVAAAGILEDFHRKDGMACAQ